MEATKLLEQQHEEVSGLFKRVEDAEGLEQQARLFDELASNLVAHDTIEREILYPACEEKLGMTELLGESLVEHGVIAFSLYNAMKAKGKDDFSHKLTVLREMVEHHVEDEEDEFFPELREAFGEERLNTLGARMQARFAQALHEPYRPHLEQNLARVLQGSINPPADDQALAESGNGQSAANGAQPPARTKGKKASKRSAQPRHS